ncbi:GIY-YIG nuclease family protein [Lacinutrix sp. Bg11-31]
MKSGFIYILTNKNKTTLYVGVTSNLIQRIN